MVGLHVLLTHDAAQLFLTEAQRHGHSVVARCETPDALVQTLREASEGVALVGAAPALLTSAVLSEADAAGIRLIAVAASSAERQHAASLGLREIVEAGAGWGGVEKLLESATARLGGDAASPRPATGYLVAVWGPAGAPGRSTVAITLAAEFAAIGHRVILVDADTHAAAIAPALGLADEAPGFAAACRLASADSLTLAELDRVAQTYSSSCGSFRVLTGLPRASRWQELGETAISGTLAACRAVADVVVVDVASSLENHDVRGDSVPRDAPPSNVVTRNIAARTVVAAADRVVSVGSADPVGLSRFLRAHPDLLEVATGEITVLVNRVRTSAIGLGPRQQVVHALARFGGIRDAALVPDDRAAFDAAVLSGRTVTEVMPRSPARAAFSELAATLMPPGAPAPRRHTRGLSRATR